MERRMNRALCIWIGFFILVALASGCTTNAKSVPSTATQETKTYTNREYKFSLAYPSDWMIEEESYQLLVLVTIAAQSWQPSVPSDIPKDPHVEIEMGGYIREKLGPANFPVLVNASSLRAWLEQKVRNGEAREFSELTINNVLAFELTEIYESNCERVVYWRPERLESLVRISTGCDSIYLGEFEQIVHTIRQMD
jgi:hypothetical protein